LSSADIDRYEVVLDKTAHSAEAIHSAAYALADRVSFELRSNDDEWICCLIPTAGVSGDPIADFRREVTDQVLRERIRIETEGVRNFIIAVAFQNTGLAESE